MVSRESPAEEGALRADVLGRLLVVQQALDVLPNEEEIAAFLCRALSEVPGVEGACLALEGRPIVASTELEGACVKARGTGVAVPGGPLPDLPGSAAYPVRTVRRSYGMLALALREPGAFDPYRPVVSNVIGTIAAALETRELLRITAAARDQLETLVETRTSELAERTERLVAEMAERERAIAALAESEERLRLIAANAQDAIVVLDEAGRVAMWNPAAERIFGRSRSEMIGQDIHEAVAPARSLDAFRRGFAAFARYGIGPFVGKSIELEAIRPDGSEFPVEISISPVKVRGHWHAIGIVRDITERKRGDTVRDALAAIVRSTTDAVVGKTTEGIVTSWNAGAERLYGYSAQEMIGKPLAILAPPGKASEIVRLTELVRAGQVVEDYETRRAHKGGRLLDVSLTLAPIRDNAGITVGVSTIARDITRRKEAERALRESEARLEEAQRIAHLGSWEWSITDGSLDTSAEALRIYGLEDRASVATFAASLERIHPADRPAVVAAVQEVLAGRSPFSIDYRIVKPDGSVRHVLGTAKVVLDAAGRPSRMVGTVQDVTERRQAELALRRTNRSLRTLSSCNQTLVRATSETELLEGMCTILVEEGGFQRAWVGLVGGRDPGLAPAACRSRDADGKAWSAAGVLAPGSPEQEVASMAVSSREPRVHLGTPLGGGDPDGVVDGSLPGPGAIAAVPLLQEEKVLGVLVLHADEPDTFDEEEIRLVSELASDLAFGIEALRARIRKEGSRPREAEVPRPDTPEPRGDRRDDRGHGRGARPVHRRSPAARGRLRRRDRERAGARRRGRAGHPPRRDHPRPGEDQGPGGDPRQTRPALRDRGADHPDSPGGRLGDPERGRVPLAHRGDGPAAPRAAGRLRLPAGSQGRADLAGGAHPRRRGRRGGDGQSPAVPPLARSECRSLSGRGRSGRPLRCRRRGRVPDSLPREGLSVRGLSPLSGRALRTGRKPRRKDGTPCPS